MSDSEDKSLDDGEHVIACPECEGEDFNVGCQFDSGQRAYITTLICLDCDVPVHLIDGYVP